MGKKGEVLGDIFEVLWSTILGGFMGVLGGVPFGLKAGDNAGWLFFVAGAVIAFILAVRENYF